MSCSLCVGGVCIQVEQPGSTAAFKLVIGNHWLPLDFVIFPLFLYMLIPFSPQVKPVNKEGENFFFKRILAITIFLSLQIKRASVRGVGRNTFTCHTPPLPDTSYLPLQGEKQAPRLTTCGANSAEFLP